jgi:hypothetical protein
MSRTIEQIQASIISDVQAQPELAEANTNSRRGIWRLITFVQASAILLLEQIIDVFKEENEIKINSAIPATTSWITNKVFNFQYSATNPQVVQLVDLVPSYPIIDSSLRIITRCSVVTTISGQVIIKSAKSDPPVALSNTELSSLQSYVNIIGVPGIKYTCLSSDADRVYIDADIYYDGQYSTVINGTVQNTINTFLSKLPFNGQLKVSDLELAIRNITGVNDILFKNLKVRANSTAFASGTFLIQNNTVISRLFPTIAGYVVLEDLVSNNFNFIAN